MVLPSILLALLLVVLSNGLSSRSLVKEEWEIFKLKHNRNYDNEEEDLFRMNVFMNNMHIISEHNSLYERGLSTYKMGMNKFGDLTDDEYKRYYMIHYDSINDGDLDGFPQKNFKTSFPSYLYSDEPMPKEKDWRAEGAVTEVQDQKGCGACYAFITTGALEAQHYLKTKILVPLSAQNILDCTYKKPDYRNTGCSGGRVDFSFKYIIENKGIDTEKSYPYVARRQKPCTFNTDSIGATMSKYVDLPPGNETALQMAVAWIGPVAVMLDNQDLRFYAGGIYDNPSCSSEHYTHGMLVVGYGTYRKLDYWLLKNSWGLDWGEMGYIMMSRNKKNQCAIATAALYPLV